MNGSSHNNSMKIRVTNKQISTETVREVMDFVRLSGCEHLTIKVKNSRHRYGGLAMIDEKIMVIKVGNHTQYPTYYRPYQYGQFRNKKYPVYNAKEMFLIIAAHESRHFWQANMKNKRGYVWGSRGRYSEVDADHYAIHMLRKWRKIQYIVP